MKRLVLFGVILVAVTVVVVALAQAGLFTRSATSDTDGTEVNDLAIVSLLPKDAIPAIFEPAFLSATEGAVQLADDDLVIGVNIDGDTRAYGVAYLSGHEIVNDTVGGQPIAITW